MMSAPMMTSGRPFPAPPDTQVTLANWRQHPYNRWGFRNVRSLIPTANVPSGEAPRALPEAPAPLDHLEFVDRQGTRHGLRELFAATHTDAYIVLKYGTVVDEWYTHGLDPKTPHILMSVSKSLTACLAAAVAERGWLDFAAPVSRYVPEVKDSAYADASVRHLLDI